MQRENRPTTTTDQVKSTTGNQFSSSRRGVGSEPAPSVTPVFAYSNAKIALCSLASTRATNERRHSFADHVEGPSFQSRKRAHSSLSCNSSDALDQQKINAASAAFAAARRPRRRPIDPFRELIVLVPEDVNDQIRKMGLTPAEIPEFLLCLDEQVDYDEEENDEEDTAAASCQHEENGNSCGTLVPIIKLEVYTPTVKINKYYEARQKAGCGFNIRSLPAQIKCSHYDEYEADSEDEKFLANLDMEYIALTETLDMKNGKVQNNTAEECSIVSTAATTVVLQIQSAGDEGQVDDSTAQNDKQNHIQKCDIRKGSQNKSKESEQTHINGNASRNIKNTSSIGNEKKEVRHRFLREDTFQQMIAVLERELEVALGTKNLLKDTKAIYTKCGSLLEHSRTASELVEMFLSEDSEEEHSKEHSKDMTISGTQKNVLSLQSLEELLTTSKKEQKFEEEEQLRLALVNGSNSIKVDSKEGCVESKEGYIKSTSALKRGRPVGRMSDKSAPHTQAHTESGTGGGGGIGQCSNGVGSGGGGGGLGVSGAGGALSVSGARRGRPPLAKGRVRDREKEKERDKERDKDRDGGYFLTAQSISRNVSTCVGDYTLPSTSFSTFPPLVSPLLPNSTSTDSFFTSPNNTLKISNHSESLTVHHNVNGGADYDNDDTRGLINSSVENRRSLKDKVVEVEVEENERSMICDSETSFSGVFAAVSAEFCHDSNDPNNSNNSSRNNNGRSQDNSNNVKEEMVINEDKRMTIIKNEYNITSDENINNTVKSEILQSREKETSKSLTDMKAKDRIVIETDPVYTEIELKSYVSKSRGLFILRKFFDNSLKSDDTINGAKKDKMGVVNVSDESVREKEKKNIAVDNLLFEVYDFWVRKRAGRISSFLRCYHNFIMKKWQRQDALPPLPEDIGGGLALKSGYTELLKLRLALEKARILADRVRRREKLKKDLLKLSRDHLDSYFSYLESGQNGGVNGDSSHHQLHPSSSSSNMSKMINNNNNNNNDSNGYNINNNGDNNNDKNYSNTENNEPQKIKNKDTAKEETHEYYDEKVEGEIPMRLLGLYNDSVLLPFSIEPGNYEYLYEKEREKNAILASIAIATKYQDVAEGSLERRERASSILSDGRERSNSMTVHPKDLTGNGHGATHWSAEDDRLLLLGVAACGVGRWSEIRCEFELLRNSSQMNQRFTRLIRRRLAGLCGGLAAVGMGMEQLNESASLASERSSSKLSQLSHGVGSNSDAYGTTSITGNSNNDINDSNEKNDDKKNDRKMSIESNDYCVIVTGNGNGNGNDRNKLNRDRNDSINDDSYTTTSYTDNLNENGYHNGRSGGINSDNNNHNSVHANKGDNHSSNKNSGKKNNNDINDNNNNSSSSCNSISNSNSNNNLNNLSSINNTSNYDDEDETTESQMINNNDTNILKKILPLSLRIMINDFDDKTVWESIAIRYLLDTQNHEKRSGRPVLHPLPIPIPHYLQNGKHFLFLHKLIERPSMQNNNNNNRKNSISTSTSSSNLNLNINRNSNSIPVIKVAPKSHKKIIPITSSSSTFTTTSSSTLKFIPLTSKINEFDNSNIKNDNNKHLNHNNGSFDSNNYIENGEMKTGNCFAHCNGNLIHNNFTIDSNVEIEKKSKSKNRKRDRNREKEKRRGRERAEKDLIKSTKLKIEKENAVKNLNNDNNINLSSTSTTTSFSTSITDPILDLTSPCTTMKEILPTITEEITIIPLENNNGNGNGNGSERGVAKRTRSSNSNIEIQSSYIITKPMLKKVEKVTENGEKRSHKKKKVEPKIAKCSCISINCLQKCKFCLSRLPSNLPISTSTSTSIPDSLSATVTLPPSSPSSSSSTTILPSSPSILLSSPLPLTLPHHDAVSEPLTLSHSNLVVMETECVRSEENNNDHNPIVPMKVEKEVETVRSSWFSPLG